MSDAPEQSPPDDPADERLSWAAHLCGAVIAGCAALPVTPDGRSFLSLLRAEFARGLLEGVMMLAGFGSPFLFGLATVAIASPRLRGLAAELVRTPIGLMHGQLLLVSFVIWRHGEAVGAAGLLGFAVVGAIAYARGGVRAPGGHRLRVAEMVRWGAVIVAGVAAWCKLQRLAEVRLGIAVDVMLVAAVALVLIASRSTRGRAVAPT